MPAPRWGSAGGRAGGEVIFFLICADEEVGRRECRERGWTQAGVSRFYTPERNDVRIVRRFVDFALLPGGTWFMAGEDFHLNPSAEDFQQLVTGGQAKWLPGEEPTEEQVEWIARQKDKEQIALQVKATHPAEVLDRETIRQRFQAELQRRQSSGARPGRPPLQR